MIDFKLTSRLVDALMRVPGIEEFSTRTALLSGIGVSLNRNSNAFTDLTNIIQQLDGLGRLSNGERPVVIVANNAARMTRGTDLARQLESLAGEIEGSYGSEPLLADLPTDPEALVFGGFGEWVTSTFIEQAQLIGTRVARLRVPRFVDGAEKKSVGELGTGWLISPGLLLTNHHVVNARQRGEPVAKPADFLQQAKHAIAWFDYYDEGGANVEVGVLDLVHSNVDLDYALLRLADHEAVSKRKPIAVPQKAPPLDRGTRLNVVQCPSGGPIRYAIRNNFFVGLGDEKYQIRYLTDTLPGSSGSPVMDDNWQAVALHHGSTQVNPKSYRAEPGLSGVVKYHNQGIEIQTILADLPAEVAVEIRRAQGLEPVR